ncbi:HD domain-containing protein [Candidatus Latescibacterota bacterium]
MLDLSLGAFLHDFGKQVNGKIRISNASKADSPLKEHPTFGYLLLSKSHSASPTITQIINQHQEQLDGRVSR